MFEALVKDIAASSVAVLAKAEKSEGTASDEKAGSDADKKVAAAAGIEENIDDPNKSKAGEGEQENKSENESDGEFAKALGVFDAEGNPVDAIDATDILKSLGESVERIEGERKAENEHLFKALGLMHDMVKSHQHTISEQGTLIKSLTDKVAALADTGRGRKTVLTVLEKSAAVDDPLKKSEGQGGITPRDFLAKCMTAQTKGLVSGLEIATVENLIHRGQAVPQELVSRVMGS